MANFTRFKRFAPKSDTMFMCFMLLAGFLGLSQPRGENALAVAKDTIITSIKITGTVIDGAPLPNIVVIEKGTQNLAVTDKNGNFSLDIPIDHFVDKKVWLRFEVLTRKPLERRVAANTKDLKINYTQKKQRQRWTVVEETQSQGVTDLISDVLDTLIDAAVNSSKSDSKDDGPSYREVKSKTPRY